MSVVSRRLAAFSWYSLICVMLAIAISLELVSNPVESARLWSPEFTDSVLVWLALVLKDIATRRYLAVGSP
jgi:hypothetical protein